MSRRNGNPNKPRYRAPDESRRMDVDAMIRQYADPPENRTPKAPRPVAWVQDVRDLMNRTEREYADILDARILAGEVSEWRYEPMSLRLGWNCHLTPDFLVILTDGRCELHEVKGGRVEEDAMVKMKTCIAIYPFFPLFLCQKKGKAWTTTRIKHGGPLWK